MLFLNVLYHFFLEIFISHLIILRSRMDGEHFGFQSVKSPLPAFKHHVTLTPQR